MKFENINQMTMSDFINYNMDVIIHPSLSYNTVRQYRWNINKILKTFGNYTISECYDDAISGILDDLQHFYSSGTIYGISSLLTTIFYEIKKHNSKDCPIKASKYRKAY